MSKERGKKERKHEREAANMRGGTPPVPEFSRPVNVSRMGRLEHRVEIAANAEERAALARRFGLLELEELSAVLVLKKRGDGVIEATGSYRGRLSQPCVVTLEPVWATIAEDLQLYFAGPLGKSKREVGSDFDPLDDEEGWPEPIVGGMIDVGEAVAQAMALALDPYPRKPGVRAPTTG